MWTMFVPASLQKGIALVSPSTTPATVVPANTSWPLTRAMTVSPETFAMTVSPETRATTVSPLTFEMTVSPETFATTTWPEIMTWRPESTETLALPTTLPEATRTWRGSFDVSRLPPTLSCPNPDPYSAIVPDRTVVGSPPPVPPPPTTDPETT